MKSSLLDVRDLRVMYLAPRGPVRAIDGVNFSIALREVFGLVGQSGSGTSTIAPAIARLAAFIGADHWPTAT